MGEIMNTTVRGSKAFPLLFLFLFSCADSLSRTANYGRWFYLLSRPKSCRHGPTSVNCVDTQHQLGCSQTALILAHCWPGMSGPWSVNGPHPRQQDVPNRIAKPTLGYLSRLSYSLISTNSFHVSPSYLTHYFRRSLSSFLYFIEKCPANTSSVLWLLLSSTLAGYSNREIRGCSHTKGAHIDLCCIVINRRRFAEYSWPSVLQGDESGGGRGEKPVVESASGHRGGPCILWPVHSPASLCSFILKAPRGKKHHCNMFI